MLTDTRAMTANYRLQHWAEILQKQKESGLNIRLFCEEMEIKEHRYFYWQRKLRETANEGLATVQYNSTELPSERTENPVIWAGVNMNSINDTHPSVKDNIKIIRDEWTVMIEPGFDAETLTEALRVVNRLCC